MLRTGRDEPTKRIVASVRTGLTTVGPRFCHAILAAAGADACLECWQGGGEGTCEAAGTALLNLCEHLGGGGSEGCEAVVAAGGIAAAVAQRAPSNKTVVGQAVGLLEVLGRGCHERQTAIIAAGAFQALAPVLRRNLPCLGRPTRACRECLHEAVHGT